MIRFRLLILALLFKVTALSAQSTLGGVYPIAPNFGKTDFRDLEAFKKEVSDARIVFLGDMIHGESNIDSARIYIIKMLIEEMGFDVLAFESGIYDLYKAELLQKEGMGIAQAVQESVFPVWTGYDSFRPLLEYLESKNGEIKTIGFDPQRSGAYASEITDDLAEFLNQCGVKYEESVLEDWDYMCADLLDFTLPEDFSKLYFNLINKKLNKYLKLAAQSPSFSEKAAIWKQIVESKKQMVSVYSQKGYLEKDAGTFRAKDSNLRDQYMAENLQFYLDLYPDKKFICWGASGHFAKSTQKIENAELKEYKPMGSYIKEKYGDKAVVVGATGYKGQYGWEESLYNIPKAAENSFEELVHQTGYKTALVDLSQFKVADIFSKNEEILCKIDFKCKEISRRAFYRSFTGTVFINLKDYAITKIVSETLVDKERTLKKTKWELENLDKTWVIRKEVDYKKEGAHYFIHHTQYYDNYWLNEFADIYYFDFALKERPIEEDDYTYEKIKFSDNAYWQGIFNKIKK